MATLMTTVLVLRTGRISNWCDLSRAEREVCPPAPQWAFAEREVAAVNKLVSPLLLLSGAGCLVMQSCKTISLTGVQYSVISFDLIHLC